MQYNQLGQTDMVVSELCLGTMTWGTQNTAQEAHQQIETALDHGVNFIDTAEMYPVNPISQPTQGDSERILGQWLGTSGKRDQVYVATKVSGAGFKGVRDGAPISAQTVTAAIEASLTSLQTDYIDLYQLHWPNRGSYMFRQNWEFDPSAQNKAQTLDHMAEVLETLDKLKQAGKLRAVGLSNESAWGTAQWLRISEEQGLPRMESLQNEYSLMCRLFDTDLAELAHNEQVGLVCYSPLATGLLSGQYSNNALPEGSRATIAQGLGGRLTARARATADAYVDVARKHGLDPCQMALAWCRTRPFMASAIFGARAEGQLENILASTRIELTEECLSDLAKVHRQNPMPF
ncbi:NADP-dependent oxidoreductase [Amylibacter marinus]|uniref:NADP-dependent oxidoreductase n=1 Tax=Amylibacter marinus TaxID=1475483 RepID=A0ABQ5VTA0_9RHOB|nr:aldo/keto reductase [Amylibacter marinus]GLQ34655.1 NADP-dependent oxidoreductase [Amylibacter marinus]